MGDVAVKVMEKLYGRVSPTLLHEQKSETSIVKKLAAAYEAKLKEMQAWDWKKKLDILRTEDLKSLSENEQYLGAIVAEQFIRSGVENQVAKGRAYLDRLVKQWEGKSVHDVAKIVLPDTTELDVDGVVVLRHFIENSKTEEKVTNKVLIDALRTRYGSDTQLSKVVLEAIEKTDKKELETKSEYDLNRGKQELDVRDALVQDWVDQGLTARQVIGILPLSQKNPTISSGLFWTHDEFLKRKAQS